MLHNITEDIKRMPPRAWLFVAIGVAGLIVAYMTYKSLSGGGSTATLGTTTTPGSFQPAQQVGDNGLGDLIQQMSQWCAQIQQQGTSSGSTTLTGGNQSDQGVGQVHAYPNGATFSFRQWLGEIAQFGHSGPHPNWMSLIQQDTNLSPSQRAALSNAIGGGPNPGPNAGQTAALAGAAAAHAASAPHLLPASHVPEFHQLLRG